MTPTTTFKHAECQNCSRTRKIRGNNSIPFIYNSVTCIKCGEKDWKILKPVYKEEENP